MANSRMQTADSEGPTFGEVSEKLQAHRVELEEMGLRYLAIFGSVAQNQAGSNSDIDLLIDLERPAGLLRFAHLQNYLAELLGHDVDLVLLNSVRPKPEKGITRQALRVF